jgi:hypothetical protein
MLCDVFLQEISAMLLRYCLICYMQYARGAHKVPLLETVSSGNYLIYIYANLFDSGSGLGSREYCRGVPLRCDRYTERNIHRVKPHLQFN